jgi:hypothetical protein
LHRTLTCEAASNYAPPALSDDGKKSVDARLNFLPWPTETNDGEALGGERLKLVGIKMKDAAAGGRGVTTSTVSVGAML